MMPISNLRVRKHVSRRHPACRTGLGLALMDDGHDEGTNGDDHDADAEDHNEDEEGRR